MPGPDAPQEKFVYRTNSRRCRQKGGRFRWLFWPLRWGLEWQNSTPSRPIL